jgi:hypothetical protein
VLQRGHLARSEARLGHEDDHGAADGSEFDGDPVDLLAREGLDLGAAGDAALAGAGQPDGVLGHHLPGHGAVEDLGEGAGRRPSSSSRSSRASRSYWRRAPGAS